MRMMARLGLWDEPRLSDKKGRSRVRDKVTIGEYTAYSDGNAWGVYRQKAGNVYRIPVKDADGRREFTKSEAINLASLLAAARFTKSDLDDLASSLTAARNSALPGQGELPARQERDLRGLGEAKRSGKRRRRLP